VLVSDFSKDTNAMTLQRLTSPVKTIIGTVVRTAGAAASIAGSSAPVGSLVEMERQSGEPAAGQVIGFREELTFVSPLGDMTGVRPGNRVWLSQGRREVHVGEALRGRVINAYGVPRDGRAEPRLDARIAANGCTLSVFDRPRIDTAIGTGVRAIDGLLPCGRGQRLGVFSEAGVGKSCLLGMLARSSEADVNVVALIGEGSREVQEFLDKNLGPEGLRKSVVVVANRDEPPLLRVEAAATATAVAEYFRDQGKDVLLLVDSLTRFGTAQRDIALAAGEMPATCGYPASVFSALARLMERPGPGQRGSITAFYAVSVEGNDRNEPISEAAGNLLDGHLVLSRELASAGHYPAVDLLRSISRAAPRVADREHLDAIASIRSLSAASRLNENVISAGVCKRGSRAGVDVAIQMKDRICAYLRQAWDEPCSAARAKEQLLELTRQRPAKAA
jgi:flagellum-specific ATP synthase